MTLLPILFWILLILSAFGAFYPSWPAQLRYGPALVLFVLLGLRVFPIAL